MPWFYNLEDTESLIYGVEAWDDLFRLCAALVPPQRSEVLLRTHWTNFSPKAHELTELERIEDVFPLPE
jgi:hypothetical protein